METNQSLFAIGSALLLAGVARSLGSDLHSARKAFNLEDMAEDDPSSKKDLDEMQGTWNLVSATQDGNALPKDKVKQTTIVVSDNTFRFPGLSEEATARAGTFTLDATKNPKEMDSTSSEKAVMLGIYELQPDSYKVCFAPAGKPRPTDFSSSPGSGYILQSWERQKKQ